MNPARVLTLIDSLEDPGGAERVAVTLSTALPPEDFQVTVATTRGGKGPLVAELEAAGVPWFALDRAGKFDLLPFRRLIAFMRRSRTEVLHSHMFGSNLWASLTAPPAGVPVRVAHEHGSPYHGGLGRTIRFFDRRVIGPAASAIVVGTEGERRNVAEAGGMPPEKVSVIPAPFVPRESRPADLHAELGLPPGAALIGTVAWLRPEKALTVLIDAFAGLGDAHSNAHLVIAGSGPSREELEARASERGVRERTHFLGAREDPVGVLASLDVAVISSDRESTSLMALEAMAAGTPLVSTRVGGPAEFLVDGESALLVETRDPDAMARAIDALLSDPRLGERIAAAAAAGLDAFSVERVVGMHAALYERMLAKHGRRRI